jgi:hypothetical protein
MGGDFNLDPWRCSERRASSIYLTPQTRHLEQIFSELATTFVRHPSQRTYTFSSPTTTSTLDHWFVSPSIQVSSCQPVDISNCQHLPLLITLDLPLGNSSGLSPRPMNLRFPPDNLQLVRAQLLMLASNLDARYLDINQLYSHIEHCFTYFGLDPGNQRQCTMAEQWTTFLRDNEKEVSWIRLSFVPSYPFKTPLIF